MTIVTLETPIPSNGEFQLSEKDRQILYSIFSQRWNKNFSPKNPIPQAIYFKWITYNAYMTAFIDTCYVTGKMLGCIAMFNGDIRCVQFFVNNGLGNVKKLN